VLCPLLTCPKVPAVIPCPVDTWWKNTGPNWLPPCVRPCRVD